MAPARLGATQRGFGNARGQQLTRQTGVAFRPLVAEHLARSGQGVSMGLVNGE
jgi:hypothetical protein